MLDYYDRWGVDPRQADSKGQAVWSVWYHLTDPTTMYAVHAAYLNYARTTLPAPKNIS